MSSAAVQVENTISKVKDYDVFFDNTALEYTSWMLPGRSEASTYNLITNLRNIEESAGDGTMNTLTIGVPCSIATYKEWQAKYDTAGVLKIASTLEGQENLKISFNVRLASIGDFNGDLSSINPIDLGFKVLSIVEEEEA